MGGGGGGGHVPHTPRSYLMARDIWFNIIIKLGMWDLFIFKSQNS